MKELDEHGFIFLDDNQRPFLCRMWGGKPWLFYWHSENHWVSLREVTQSEIFMFPHNLTEEHQQLYHDLNEVWIGANS